MPTCMAACVIWVGNHLPKKLTLPFTKEKSMAKKREVKADIIDVPPIESVKTEKTELEEFTEMYNLMTKYGINRLSQVEAMIANLKK